jgi:hypothetical protein
MRLLWVAAIMRSASPKNPTFVSKGDTTQDEGDTANNFDCYDSSDYSESRIGIESRGVRTALRKT